MPQQHKYAIRCSTEEQARECDSKKLLRYTLGTWYKFSHDTFGMYMLSKFNLEGYTIITYEEAISEGLLGEKKVCKSCLGKKQNSVMVNHSFTDDFTGVRHEQKPTIEMMNCGRCSGTGIEPEFIPEVEPQQNEVQESPSEEYSMEEAERDIQEDIGISKYAMVTHSEDNLVEKLIEKREKRFIQLQTYPKSEIHKAMRNEIGIFIDDLKHLSSK